MRKKFIPTINISKFKLKNNNSNNKKILNQIQRACIEVGFFQIIGHGIDKSLINNKDKPLFSTSFLIPKKIININ